MRIIRHNNNLLLNGLLVWWHQIFTFSKPIDEMSKEELKVFLKGLCTSARKKDMKDGTMSVYKSSSMKSISEPPLIVSFARCRSTNSFPLALSALLLRQIKH